MDKLRLNQDSQDFRINSIKNAPTNAVMAGLTRHPLLLGRNGMDRCTHLGEASHQLVIVLLMQAALAEQEMLGDVLLICQS